MFLLIHESKNSSQSNYWYLHSTMFLLILCENGLSFVLAGRFTFHNVSINTTLWAVWLSSQLTHLHSTMFLLILMGNKQLHITSGYDLHSTMFLLIQLYNYFVRYLLQNLHSTMFLLIPLKGILSILSGFIYIPQCFY